MSDTVSMTNLPSETELLRTARRIQNELQQHWTSTYAARRIHLIGIGGCGMSGLAGVLLRCGAAVSGSDLTYNDSFGRLEELGATIRLGQAPLNVPRDCDMVVYSAAIKDDNLELAEARRRHIRCVKYAEMLGQVMRQRIGMAISGTHGKSTTTAMLSYILRRARLDPTFVVGAQVKQLGGSCGVGDGPHFVVEACEYDRSFLNLAPKLAAILNIEEDHLDYYSDLNAIMSAFRAFAMLVPAEGTVIVNADDATVMKTVQGIRAPLETFGLGAEAYWRAANLEHVGGCYRFDIYRDGELFLHASLDYLPGRHQVGNALAATALAWHAGLGPEAIAEGLATFSGATRRMTIRGEMRGILLMDDYGHHPTEIRATLQAVREQYPNRRLWVIFQPHQHSRTRFLLDDFARSFGQADILLVPDIYFVRDSEAERQAISSRNLVDRVREYHGNALYLPAHQEIVEHVVDHARENDIVVTMGAGDVWKIGDELVRRLG